MNEVNDRTIEEWVGQAKNGDTEAFRSIFELMSDQLFSYALSHTKSREDALDVVQETFIELWNAISGFSYQSREAFYGFVYIVLKRRIYRNYKKAGNTVALEDQYLEESYEMDVEDYRHLYKFISNLPENYQELLRLRYWSSLPFRDIAACLNIKETTAKVWHYRAVKELQKQSEYLA
jgi:RNA polymerase sigma-70 factor, ECF subfamily